MMQGSGRNIQALFPAWAHVAVIVGQLMLVVPACDASCAKLPGVLPEYTHAASTQTHAPTARHTASHADVTGTKAKSVHAGKTAFTVVTPIVKPFSMDVMIERLKKTDAIGVLTKLALRSDARDLVDKINAYKRNKTRYSMKDLRARFNGLILKVLALLDSDPKLSRDIYLARKCIWKSLLGVKG